MFNLNKSLAKLQSFLKENDLQKKQVDSSLPTKTTVQKKIRSNGFSNKRTKNNPNTSNGTEERRGVLMIKNFPHGFYEQQMYEYFSQFGEVTRLKIMRSRKTGKPKNYGFIEFRFEDVAEIAAQTMDNYLMFDRIVKCRMLPLEKVNANIFKNWNRPFVSSVEKHRLTHNQPKTTRQELRMVQRQLRRIGKMNNLLAENGIEFETVIINRPTDLELAIDNNDKTDVDNVQTQSIKSKSKHKLSQSSTTDSMPIEMIRMIRPKTACLSTLLKRKRLINAKFMKMKAGFRV
ncbi:uncharacterized protein LOC113795585 [Dermatophagoides pteronyssinus]|uniref:uncharacterized protein LOC113795585 n=1 Tax=Dermatophagoides pteronyssinus TaxID=6956 RepID=UPI003F66D9BC